MTNWVWSVILRTEVACPELVEGKNLCFDPVSSCQNQPHLYPPIGKGSQRDAGPNFAPRGAVSVTLGSLEKKETGAGPAVNLIGLIRGYRWFMRPLHGIANLGFKTYNNL